MEIQLTRHAQEKMDLLGIEESLLIECLAKGATTKQTDGYLASYTYLQVVYKIKPDGTYKIKTIFIE